VTYFIINCKMANTFTQIYIHIVFAVKGRQNLISKNWKDELYKYITGIIANEGQKLIVINGMSDHIHILVGLKPDKSLSDLVRDIKANSSRFINEKSWINGKFEWQTGFGAFSYNHSQLTNVIHYIQNQEEHHKKKSFKEEYIEFLKAFDVDYKNEYIFDDVL
jgi:putative transposase